MVTHNSKNDLPLPATFSDEIFLKEFRMFIEPSFYVCLFVMIMVVNKDLIYFEDRRVHLEVVLSVGLRGHGVTSMSSRPRHRWRRPLP